MNADRPTRPSAFEVLRRLFGDNRAEWPPERFSDLFVEPPYFKKLEAMRPSMLVGGRGTGKTTALRSLRFDATLARLQSQGLGIGDQTHFGVLVRINKNRVHAFQGAGIEAEDWRKAFVHYFNLLVCVELADLTIWLEEQFARKMPQTLLRHICEDLGLQSVASSVDLRGALTRAISELQLHVNNPKLSSTIVLSIAEAPILTFANALNSAEFLEDRIIFCCIDEYENLLDDQQALINTYIKHSTPPVSYKIGVRKNGLRNRLTIDKSELLRNPDDYEDIDIANEGFEYFARAVANLRLNRAKGDGAPVPATLGEFLSELTFSEEATLLGADSVAADVLEQLKVEPDLYEVFRHRPSSETYFLQYWSMSEKALVVDLARDWLRNPGIWENRLNNHGYASLFWLSDGRKGARIRKYYCGERVLLALPSGNIRYFLELIDAAISFELGDSPESVPRELRLSARSQTEAARLVGQRRLEQIEHVADHGVQLKRLALAIGKVFFELARSPLGRTPEITSFVLAGDQEAVNRLTPTLKEGVANLVFEVTPRTKATTNHEMRDDEFRLHPIFCAFFEISHRRKRRMTMKAEDLLLVLEQPARAISQILDGTDQSAEDQLPEQLAFFSTFFAGGGSQ